MDRDDRIPTEVSDVFWVLAFNEKANYHVKRGNSGKWLIFEHVSEIDAMWIKVREATRLGKLGGSSKTSTIKPNPNASDLNYKVICVYTSDFDDKADLKRIEENIRSLGIENKLIYKLDKDAGRYQNQGHKNLSQAISYCENYFVVQKWLQAHEVGKYIVLRGLNRAGKKRYRFRRVDLSPQEFERRKYRFRKLGFHIEMHSEILGEEFYFTE